MMILHIDDDPDDREMLQSALFDVEPMVQYEMAANGMDAIKYLQTAKITGKLPSLIVLDINMPVLDGKRTLEYIRSSLGMEELPVVIFTSSRNPNDALFFETRAKAFITKPSHFKDLYLVAKRIIGYCEVG